MHAVGVHVGREAGSRDPFEIGCDHLLLAHERHDLEVGSSGNDPGHPPRPRRCRCRTGRCRTFRPTLASRFQPVPWRRRCQGTWWAPPPSKRLSQAIPARRVRFPSTSANPFRVNFLRTVRGKRFTPTLSPLPAASPSVGVGSATSRRRLPALPAPTWRLRSLTMPRGVGPNVMPGPIPISLVSRSPIARWRVPAERHPHQQRDRRQRQAVEQSLRHQLRRLETDRTLDAQTAPRFALGGDDRRHHVRHGDGRDQQCHHAQRHTERREAGSVRLVGSDRRRHSELVDQCLTERRRSSSHARRSRRTSGGRRRRRGDSPPSGLAGSRHCPRSRGTSPPTRRRTRCRARRR